MQPPSVEATVRFAIIVSFDPKTGIVSNLTIDPLASFVRWGSDLVQPVGTFPANNMNKLVKVMRALICHHLKSNEPPNKLIQDYKDLKRIPDPTNKKQRKGSPSLRWFFGNKEDGTGQFVDLFEVPVRDQLFFNSGVLPPQNISFRILVREEPGQGKRQPHDDFLKFVYPRIDASTGKYRANEMPFEGTLRCSTEVRANGEQTETFAVSTTESRSGYSVSEDHHGSVDNLALAAPIKAIQNNVIYVPRVNAKIVEAEENKRDGVQEPGPDLMLRQVFQAGWNSFWKSGRPPAWAKDWGRDQYGSWVSFEVAASKDTDDRKKASPITQRMRWIPPGRFLMGSPRTKDLHFSNEGPQREVTLTQGFWMFETPVTQELWMAVMDRNPSKFSGSRHPVENVSWNECQDFVRQLNNLIAGLNLSLPRDAQRDYACRAGTQTVYSFGDDSARLGDFAWYYQNSEDKTHPVATKLPNPWGLFDMHGNVRDWCRDDWYKWNQEHSVVDPFGRCTGSLPVYRGGCYSSHEGDASSAYRNCDTSGNRSWHIGFRCTHVLAGEEPTGEDGLKVEPTGVPMRSGEAVALRLDEDSPQQIEVPTLSSIRIRSDFADLDLYSANKPNWASAIGRDEFGLWAELTFPTTSSDPAIQRMRWIPPGRFSMGSPEDELGRRKESSEGPQRLVMITHGYWMFDTPVTQKLWRAVMNVNPSKFFGDLRPVDSVTWEESHTFVTNINSMITNLNLSLPTEAEWEYACRAGSQTAFCFGDNAEKLDDYAWYESNSNRETHRVAEKLPNSMGLYDMHGNVYEWCHDFYEYSSYVNELAVNPTGPSSGDKRVLRGGSYGSVWWQLRSACRFKDGPRDRYVKPGFRCVQVHPASRAGR